MKNFFHKELSDYAFIDAKNLNLGVAGDVRVGIKLLYKGWKIHLRKLFVYLKEHYKVEKAYLFLGYMSENERMYQSFRACGFALVFKPVMKDGTGRVKGQCRCRTGIAGRSD